MSKHYQTEIECPKCGGKAPFTVWESINTTLDPEMKEKVLDKSAFLLTCPKCGDKNFVDYGFLYHDMDKQIMIAYSQTDENAEEMYKEFTDKENGAFGGIGELVQARYILRITRSLNRLREKIYIFGDEFDDRIIELYKLFLMTQLKDKVPDIDNTDIFYFSGEKKTFEFVAETGYIGSVDLNKDFYDHLNDAYGKKLPDIADDDPIIDKRYAFNVIKTIKE